MPEEKVIIEEALKFTRIKIGEYHSDWIKNSPSVNIGEIDKEQAKYDKYINIILTLLSDPKTQNEMRRDSDWHGIDEHILSALSIYSKELEKAIDPDLSSSKRRFLIVKRLLESKRFKGGLSTVWNKYYDGFGVQDRGKNGLLFFSYSSKDRKIVGKISDSLELQFNYHVFRAHDTIKISRNWREEIKRNLDECSGLVAYVTEDFIMSPWTNQECGWALSRGITVYPIYRTSNKPGLLEEIQGHVIGRRIHVESTVKRINDTFSS